MHANRAQFALKALAIGAALAFCASADAADAALNALGQAGGLVIPYAFTLPDGMAEAQYNNYIDPRYGKQATNSQVYWGAFGLFPYVEVAGGLANYPGDVPAPFSGADHFIFRHLMADVKVEVPQFFKYQPAIAFGITDVGGQTHFFRSTYGVVSQGFGPLNLTVGYGHGDRLDGVFGGAQLSLWSTGLSLLAEDDSKTPYVGVRYQSPRISWLADANLVATVMRAVKSTDGVSPRTSVSVGVQIPLGKRFSEQRCSGGLCQGSLASAQQDDTAHIADLPVEAQSVKLAALPIAVSDTGTSASVSVSSSASAAAKASAQGAFAYTPPLRTYSPVVLSEAAPIAAAARTQVVAQALDSSVLDLIASQLFAAGLERVRVGISGQDLVVEYENHRYNQNEADALGIALGVATANAPPGIERIRAVIKKSNEPLAEITMSREAYAQFIAGGSPAAASASLTMHTQTTYDANAIEWHGNASHHGLTRIQISPITNYLYGTEYSNFDLSIGANIAGYVPLWRGAELYANYIAPFYNTVDMDNGHVYSQYRLRGGLANAVLAQSFWIMPGVFNVAAVGKFDYHYLGIENETTAFVPGRPDIVRLRLAYLHPEPGHDELAHETNALLSYRWVEPSWKMWIEGGVARYVGGDTGPLITLTRWFDDVSVSIYGQHSGRGSFAGVTLSFPLTPRQGMKPSITQVEGTSQFDLNFRTRVGSTNYLNASAAENLDFAYSSQINLLNQGRFSAGYFSTQLYRMRDAYDRYVKPDAPAPAPTQVQPTASAVPSAEGSVSTDACKGIVASLKNAQAQPPVICE